MGRPQQRRRDIVDGSERAGVVREADGGHRDEELPQLEVAEGALGQGVDGAEAAPPEATAHVCAATAAQLHSQAI
eukprot:3442817-Pyramimonas_sp.AAC.1